MYQSPLRPAGITDSPPDKKSLQLARRKLLAEVELSGQPAVTIEGYTLNRQLINTLFDELADEALLAMHVAIFQHKPLLDFLEKGIIGSRGIGDVRTIQAIAPGAFSAIAATAVQELIRRILKGEAPAWHYPAAHSLMALLPPAELDEVHQPAFRAYAGRSSSLEAMIADEKGKRPTVVSETLEWFDADKLELLNALPGSFDDLRYSVASNLNNLAVALDNNKKSRAAYAVILKANEIDVPASLKQLMVNNRAIFRRNRWGYFGKMSWLQRLYAIVIIFFVLSALISNFIDFFTPYVTTTQEAADTRYHYPMDTTQQQNQQVYAALKRALAGWYMDITQKDSTIIAYFAELQRLNYIDTTQKDPTIVLPLSDSSLTYPDPMAGVWKALFNNSTPAWRDSAGAGRMLFINKLSAMDVIVLINVDNRSFSSIYLRPGQARTFFYKGDHEAGFSFYIGSKWQPSATHDILLPGREDAPQVLYRIKGAFTEVPQSQEYLSGNSDQFARTNIRGKPFTDTVQIVAGNENQVEFLLGLDERDLLFLQTNQP